MAYSYMPVSFSMKGRSCLVVGGGRVALRKVETLLDYDTSITVIAPDVDPRLEYHAKRGRIVLEKRRYRSPEASEYGLVISAGDDKELNRQVYEDCRDTAVPVNVVDDPSRCDFIFPAVIRREWMTAAIATDGKAPFMSGHLRIILENIFPEHWNKLMKLAAVFRKKVQARWPGQPDKKNACYARFLEADWKSLLKEKDDEDLAGVLDGLVEP